MKKRRHQSVIVLLVLLLHQSWHVFFWLFKFQQIYSVNLVFFFGGRLGVRFSCQLQVASYVITVPKQRWEFPVLPWGKILHINIIRFFVFLH